MKQLNVPKKLTARVQIWASVLLLIIATCLSLTPIITLNTVDNADDINKMLADITPEGSETFVIPETVDVSAIKIVKSIGVIAKVVKTTMDAAKAEDMSNVGSDIADVFKTEDGQETIVIALSFASTVSSNFDTKDTSGSAILASVLTVMVSVIALIALLVMTFVIPVMLLIATVSALISALANLSTPEEVSTKIGRKLPGFISLPFTLMLFQCVVPGMTYGSGIVGICVTAILAAVLGLVISRLRSYDAPAFRYLNIVQGVSILGGVGFVVFFFNLVKTNIFTNFLHGKFADYVVEVAKVMAANIKAENKPEINNSYLIDLALIFVYVILALGSVTYLEKCVQRLACSASANKKGAFPKDTCIVRAVLMLAVYILPTVVIGRKSFYKDPTVLDGVGDESLLVLNTEETSALNMVLVGIILMLVAEIALIVLKAVFCKGMNRESMTALMSGAEAAETAEAEAVAEETAEEAATEEAVEETAEETVEEAAETEAVAEEATEEVAQ